MPPLLRILHLEDDPRDAELIAVMLAADGLSCEIERVSDETGFESALGGAHDLILSDYTLPSFDGVTAQRIAHQHRPDVPFVFVSGTMGEEVAIERLNAGATDYVLKQRLERLPRAIRRALHEAQDRRDRDRAQAEVHRLNAELEGRVAERTRQLQEAIDSLGCREAELRKATVFLDSIVENLPAMVFVKDARDGRFVLFNRAGEELLGVDRKDLLGRTGHELFPAPIAEALVRSDTAVLDGGVAVSAEDEVVATRTRGVRILHTKKIPVADADGKLNCLLGIAVDITDRRHAEEEARLARLEAERANRAKSQFLSRMSHDLRTPLNAMLGFAQLLDLDAGLSSDQTDSVRHIIKGGGHLLELVNEVLDIARIEAGQLGLSMEPVPVAEVLQEVVDFMRPLADARAISLSVPTAERPWHVIADKQRLKQILLNLVGNAVKYNRDQGSVQLAVDGSGGRVRIWVRDTGPGIPSSKRALLFKPFERLGAEHGPLEGTGLGLALAKGLAEAMSGTIGAESSSEGATFWIELPEGEAEQHRPAAIPAPSRDVAHSRGTVLYIEDNDSNVRLLQRLLSRRPAVRLLIAKTAAEGIGCAVRERPDLILLDLHLPDRPGEDVLRALLEDQRTSGIPVAILSADATYAQSDRLLKAGARAYLTKPFVLTSLLEVIDTHLAGPVSSRPESACAADSP